MADKNTQKGGLMNMDNGLDGCEQVEKLCCNCGRKEGCSHGAKCLPTYCEWIPEVPVFIEHDPTNLNKVLITEGFDLEAAPVGYMILMRNLKINWHTHILAPAFIVRDIKDPHATELVALGLIPFDQYDKEDSCPQDSVGKPDPTALDSQAVRNDAGQTALDAFSAQAATKIGQQIAEIDYLKRQVKDLKKKLQDMSQVGIG